MRKLDDCSRLGDGFKRLHCLAHNPALEFGLMRFAGLMSERKIEKYRARRINCLRNIKGRGHTERRNSGGFDNSRNQSNGLMAHGSGGYQVECIDVGTLEFARDFRGQLVANLSR
jgi:hypothetical protein